ncbi:glycoside hydrolase family 3 protein [Marivivens sp. JLT3646]|uniref:beta-glucosidase n=1 Tax=Marivivens sp. JLT3646 TaxID=1920883 RepID=UPI00080088B3|nr:glycoside hydrolase family 3 C-terminal domain-containing protein [Marivivens sp. JLT3646]APO87321.1 glycosyl hydrolase [Marivivens sp. JLT3646]OBR35834.1 glycosyl hydrolase [Donghicola sp. JL3646]
MATQSIEAIVDEMTLEEQVAILAGADFWSTPENQRLGIAKMRVTDGPNGARGGGSLFGGVTAAAFPVGIAIGASWDPELAEQIGSAIADEVKSKCAHVALAPTINLHRGVTNGRNFECYSEDPELTSALAVGYIRGLQSKGVAASPKHFAGNESEIERTTISSDIDERTMRELYLRPFEDAVKKAGTWAIMSSYNRLNGTYTAENEWLLTDVLRKEWGYDGIVMSDWFGSRSTAPTVNAGLDLEMPGPTRDRGDKLVAAVHSGEVSRETVRSAALNMLRLMERVGSLNDTTPFRERADDLPEHRALIRKAGAEGMVMLKNDGVLPLSPEAKVALIGPNAKEVKIMGGGSAQLNPHYMVSPFDALLARIGVENLSFAKGCTNHRWEPILTGDFELSFYRGHDLTSEPAHTQSMDSVNAFWVPPFAGGQVDPTNFAAKITGTYTPTTSGIHHIGAHAAGYARVYVDDELIVDCWEDAWTKGRTFFEEGNDEVVGAVELTAGRAHDIRIEFRSKTPDNLNHSALRVGISVPMTEADIAQAAEIAAQADVAVVVIGRSGEWDTEGWDMEDIHLPGRQNELVAAVTAANPNTVVVLQTGGPVEMPWVSDVAAILQAWYGGQEAGNSIVDVLYGDAEPAGRLPQTFPIKLSDNPAHSQDPEIYPGLDGHVRYAEGVMTGYRHYEKHGIAPMFPFGFGMSYTDFDLGQMDLSDDGDDVICTIPVTNTGARCGSTVVQVYVGDLEASVERPARELKAFAKVTLDAGETKIVRMTLQPRAFAFFDVTAGQWRIEAGSFTVEAGFSAADIRSVATVLRDDALIPV